MNCIPESWDGKYRKRHMMARVDEEPTTENVEAAKEDKVKKLRRRS